jgi:hypothetical protein
MEMICAPRRSVGRTSHTSFYREMILVGKIGNFFRIDLSTLRCGRKEERTRNRASDGGPEQESWPTVKSPAEIVFGRGRSRLMK